MTSVRLSEVQHFFVACLDSELAGEMAARKIPFVHLPSKLGSGDLEWGGDLFKQRVSWAYVYTHTHRYVHLYRVQYRSICACHFSWTCALHAAQNVFQA